MHGQTYFYRADMGNILTVECWSGKDVSNIKLHNNTFVYYRQLCVSKKSTRTVIYEDDSQNQMIGRAFAGPHFNAILLIYSW